jgi:hypothetical protein
VPRHSRDDFYNSALQSESAVELILVHHGDIINDLSKLLWSQKTSYRVKWRLRLKADYYLCSIKAARLINRSSLLAAASFIPRTQAKQAALLCIAAAAAVDTSEKAAFFAAVELVGFVLCVLLIYSSSSLILFINGKQYSSPPYKLFWKTNFLRLLLPSLTRGTFCVRARP